MSAELKRHNSLLELTGLAVSMLAGAVAGIIFPIPIPLKGEGAVATVVILALIGAIVWTRRRQPTAITVVACLLAFVLGWPMALLILDWLHRYY